MYDNPELLCLFLWVYSQIVEEDLIPIVNVNFFEYNKIQSVNLHLKTSNIGEFQSQKKSIWTRDSLWSKVLSEPGISKHTGLTKVYPFKYFKLAEEV